MRRGCGTREAGGIYLEVGLSPFGSPLEEFIVDPPLPVDVAGLGITPIGMHLIGNALFDWVGSTHYPTPAHFVEEVRRHGLSRKISPTFDFSKLRGEVTHVLIHAQAGIDNWASVAPRTAPCPTGNLAHDGTNPTVCCGGLWYMQQDNPDKCDAPYTVPLPDGYSTFWAYPNDTPLEYSPAIFMRFTVQRVVVVDHPDAALVAERIERARASGLEVLLVSE